MKIFFKGFNYSQDGPGNRLVFHLQGCNMKCPWCSNPEGMKFEGGEEYSVEEVIKEALSCRPMFFSGGGVTFTGGEATMQYSELSEALSLLREAGIHTAIETNGSSPKLREIEENVDYLIMDFKNYDPERYLAFTGVKIDELLANYEYLSKKRTQLHIRIPLINGVNTDEPDKFASYLASVYHKNTVFEFLPYHEYGKAKWKSEYKIKNGFISEDQINNHKLAFKKYGLTVIET